MQVEEKGRAKGRSIALWSAGGVALIGTAAIIAGVAYLRSPSGTRFVLAQARQALSDRAGVRFEYARGTIDPFSGAHLEDFRLVRDQGGSHLEITIPSLDLQYGFSIWSRRLEVRKLELHRPSVVYRGETAAAPPASDPAAAQPIDLAALERRVARPPIQLVVRELRVEGMSVDAEQLVAGTSLRTRIEGIALKTRLEWVSKRFSTEGEFDLGRSDAIRLILKGAKESGGDTEVVLRPEARARWGLLLREESGGWVREAQPSEAKLVVRDLSVSRAGSRMARIDSQELTLGWDAASSGKEPGVAVGYVARGVSAPSALARTVDLGASARLRISPDLRSLDGHGRLTVLDFELLDADTRVALLPAGVELEGHGRLRLGSRLYAWLKSGGGLRSAGELEAGLRWSGKRAGALAEGRLEASVEQKSGGAVRIEPLLLRGELKRDPSLQQVELSWTASEPSLKAPSLKEAFAITASGVARWGAERLEERGSLTVSQLSGGGALGAVAREPLQIEHEVSVLGDRLELRSFSASLGKGLLKVAASGGGKLKSGDFEARGTLVASFPADFPAVSGLAFRGAIEMPWTLSWAGGREVEFRGTALVEKLSVLLGRSGATGISGRIPISEKLVLEGREGKRLRFAHLINQNPFERVDFERVRPLIEGAEQVRVEELRWEEKTYGPLVGYFSLEQNMLQAQRVDVSFGKGRLYSEMFLNVHPASLRFGLLSRITELDLAETLPARFLARVSGGDMRVSARSGIVVDLNKHAVDGRIDVTQIGSPQLNAMINVLDPRFEDEKLNKLRGQLGLGYPEYVKIALAQGYMNMKIGMNVQGVRFEEPCPGIPVSPWIAASTAEVVKKAKEGPLR